MVPEPIVDINWFVHTERDKRGFLSPLFPCMVAPASYLGVYRSYLERIKLEVKCSALQEMTGLITAWLDKRLEGT